MLEGMGNGQRRRAILAEMAKLGPTAPGSITERRTRCQSEGCHCHGDPAALHGPYLAWTHREEGRQVTRAITAEQAAQIKALIDADRRLHHLVQDLESLGVETVNELLG